MTRNTKVQILASVVLAACMACSVVLSTALTAVAGKDKLVQTDRAEDSASPQVAAGIAMGAFRGIFVNFLWIRANEMKEAGKFFDAIELAQAITKLQPRFPRVWVFHAWNMAYNISVMTATSEERWNWVNAGIRLIRDEGLRANPNDMLLHKELGWIYLHKIGGFTDDANAYYKRRLAMEWTVVMGPPPPYTREDRDKDHRVQKMIDWLNTVAMGAATLEECVGRDPGVAELVEQIGKLGYKLDYDTLGRYEMVRASKNSIYRNIYFERLKASRPKEAPEEPSRMERFVTLVEDPAHENAWKEVISYIRRELLSTEYNMEPQRMMDITRRYGPIDWRHHAAHALYWSTQGIDRAMDRLTHDNRRDFDTLNTDRISVQAIQELFRSGEMYFDFFAMSLGRSQYAMLQGVPNGHFVDSYGQIVEFEARPRSWADQTDNRGFTSLSGGFENFLKDVICYFYRRGEFVKAEGYYSQLRNYGGLNLNNPNRRIEMSVPLEEFVTKELNDRATSPNVAIAQIAGSLIGAYTSGLLAGDTELFKSQFEFAKRFHKYFFEQQRKAVVVNKQYVRMDQMEPDFRLAAGIMFSNWIQSLGIDDASIVYGRAPDDLQKFSYDIMRSHFGGMIEELAKVGEVQPFEKLFPEPPQMELFREDLKRMLAARGEGAVDAEQK
jgi:hypothetical protein